MQALKSGGLVKYTARLVREWARRDPHCWFCDVEVVTESDTDLIPDNFATFDHMYQKCNPDTPITSRFAMPGRLACKYCNDLRGRVGQRLTRYGARRINKYRGTGAFSETRFCGWCGIHHPVDQDGCPKWTAILVKPKEHQNITFIGIGRKEAYILNEKVTEAAAKLEELAADMKQAVIDLRENGNQVFAYERLYHLRTALGRIVQSLGVGVPMRYQAPQTARPVGDGTRATEINHAAEHQAPPSKCVICDRVYAHDPEAYKGD